MMYNGVLHWYNSCCFSIWIKNSVLFESINHMLIILRLDFSAAKRFFHNSFRGIRKNFSNNFEKNLSRRSQNSLGRLGPHKFGK